MTHRDRAGDPPGRREAAGDAGHRQGLPTPSDSPVAGSPARPERRFPKAFGRPMALRRGAWLPMSRIATPRACSPKALGSRLYGSLSTLLGIRPSRSNLRDDAKANSFVKEQYVHTFATDCHSRRHVIVQARKEYRLRSARASRENANASASGSREREIPNAKQRSSEKGR